LFIHIHKPAVDGPIPELPRVVVTSYLDHPIGQLGAAYAASVSKCLEPCGLLSHTAYKKNPFSERFQIVNERLVPDQSGTGIGYDDLLENMNWKRLV